MTIPEGEVERPWALPRVRVASYDPHPSFTYLYDLGDLCVLGDDGVPWHLPDGIPVAAGPMGVETPHSAHVQNGKGNLLALLRLIMNFFPLDAYQWPGSGTSMLFPRGLSGRRSHCGPARSSS